MADYREEDGYLIDADSNRAGIRYFGSRAAAEEALASLKNCKNCLDCSDCLRCSDCSGCSRCLDCSGCSRCSDCLDCSRCLDCSGCKKVAFLANKTGISADPEVQLDVGVPPIPRIDDIHQRVFGAACEPAALRMEQWHNPEYDAGQGCGTTHCRAGWVVALAGDAGRKLEKFYNTELAAMLIYRESGYHINPARFYDTNDDALADMKRLAEGVE